MYRRITFAAGLAAANALIPDIHQRQAASSSVASIPTTAASATSAGSSVSSGSSSGSSSESSASSGSSSSSGSGSSSISATAAGSAPIISNFVAAPYSYNQSPTINSAALESAASFAHTPASDIPGATDAAQPLISGIPETYHGPYTGPPATATGAIGNTPANSSVPQLPPNPQETTYNPNGTLNHNLALPYQPAGGIGTGGNEPVYRVQSDFDYQSILLGLYQEWIELDLFHYILATFSDEEFTKAGLTPSDRFLIEFMADQEDGHATLLSNLLGGPGGATPQCTYNYPFGTLREAFDFTQKLTRWGESGVWGFQAHLDSREVAQLLDQSIATEARQQQIFRQFAGLFPMPVFFETGIPQSWAWTLLAPYISSCPASAKRIAWQNFPQLNVLNQPNSARANATATGYNETVGFGPAAPASDAAAALDSCENTNQTGFSCVAAISQNRSLPLSWPGRAVQLSWEAPGVPVGPNLSYVTTTTVTDPKYVVWVSQFNVTYSPLQNVTKASNGTSFGMTLQPDVSTYEGDPAINETMFIALTDTDAPYSMFNLSLINSHVAALAIYQAG